MTETEEKVLVREIGKLAGFLGGFGARLAARRLPVEESETSVEVAANRDDVRASVSSILQGMGRLTNEFASETTSDSISAIVGSGHMNLNPTIVHVRLAESSNSSTRLLVRALAKEGMVKQHSAERAIRNIRVSCVEQVWRITRWTGAASEKQAEG